MTAEDGFKDHVTQIFRQRANGATIIFSIELELTNLCHNACPYCGADAGSKPAEIDFEALRTFLVNSAYHLRGRGCRALALSNSGGLYNKDPQCWVEV